MKTKKIKVLYSTRENSRGYAYPKIQMEGRWLEELGFQIGTRLVIEYEEGSIHIRPFTAEETAYEEKRQAMADLEKKSQGIRKAPAHHCRRKRTARHGSGSAIRLWLTHQSNFPVQITPIRRNPGTKPHNSKGRGTAPAYSDSITPPP